MFLHNEKEQFEKLINEVAEATDTPVEIIEKDYYA